MKTEQQRAARTRQRRIAAICDSSRTWSALTDDEKALVGTESDLALRRRSRLSAQEDLRPSAADFEKLSNIKWRGQ